MTDSLLNADAMQKFIAKIFAVITRSLIRRGATNRLAGFNRGSSSRETD
ncbi:hypothetical protein ALC57_03445 [Trachymyrmex cornetzi]|uniref:Uncharacterized protein n=1 Tax=Trachymyrmex cornetzi TaxID=471704 RepID=A0A195EGT4_9HYME|nr:hypothetical protein ALC57_03445 [Trachymyrmex cornetzi]